MSARQCRIKDATSMASWLCSEPVCMCACMDVESQARAIMQQYLYIIGRVWSLCACMDVGSQA